MALKYSDGRTPVINGALVADGILQEAAKKTISEVDASLAELAFHKALMSIWEFINVTNKHIVDQEPWTLAKSPENRSKLEHIIYHLLEALRVISVLIAPFMPASAEKIMEQIGIVDKTVQDFQSIRRWGGLPGGSILKRCDVLFPRVSFVKEGAAELPAKKAAAPVFKQIIDYEDWDKIDLRAARILEAEAVPQSDKLVKLKIDIGEERVIVAGILKDYKPEELIGKSIVVVANLKPVKLKGIESQGMLLAVHTAEGLALLSFNGNPAPGAKIS
jgi:methionyl-tRNA synthetase